MKPDSIITARKVAEASVSDMKDNQLKAIAFQTILTQLLQYELGGGRNRQTVVARSSGKTVRASAGTTDRLMSLLAEGFFDQQRSLADIRNHLAEKGWHYKVQDIGTPVTRLVQRKQLRRTQQAEGSKKIWKYSLY